MKFFGLTTFSLLFLLVPQSAFSQSQIRGSVSVTQEAIDDAPEATTTTEQRFLQKKSNSHFICGEASEVDECLRNNLCDVKDMYRYHCCELKFTRKVGMCNKKKGQNAESWCDDYPNSVPTDLASTLEGCNGLNDPSN